MKKQIVVWLCLLCCIQAFPHQKQDRKGTTATWTHPWQGKRVAYLGDSITDPRNNGSKKK